MQLDTIVVVMNPKLNMNTSRETKQDACVSVEDSMQALCSPFAEVLFSQNKVFLLYFFP